MSQELKDIKEDVVWLEDIKQRLSDAAELNKLAQAEKDEAVKVDVEREIKDIESALGAKEYDLRFSGPHDRADAIMSIQAGAGGTDAQDWAEMLERMYLRLAENKDWAVHILERSAGEEAGLKHTTFEVRGKNVFGLLKQEHGVHRLVRQSPFNADHLRQTSFARVEVLPKLPEAELPEIDPKDLEVDTFRSSGAGGQHVNKTSSAVRVRHVPTGIVVECQNERSQGQNKAQALSVLKTKLQALMEKQQAARISELKGEIKEAAWGNQIRSYVLHPYKMVKDHRTNVETSDTDKVLNGDLDTFLNAPFEAQ